MSLTIEDLKPKKFKITIKGVEVECKPLRLSHALTISQIGEVFNNSKKTSTIELKKCEEDMDNIIGELIPELKDIELDVASILDVITQMMGTIQPTDNKYLNENEVSFDSDPKAEKIG